MNSQDDQAAPDALPPTLISGTMETLAKVVEAQDRHDRMIENLVASPEFKKRMEEVHQYDEDVKVGKQMPEPPPLDPTSRAGQFRLYIQALNDEGSEGYANAKAIVAAEPAKWDALLEENPGWIRCGTFSNLLRWAEELIETEPERAHAITSFVIQWLNRVPAPEHAQILADKLPGEAWLTHAKALASLKRYDEALATLDPAAKALEVNPVLVAMDKPEIYMLMAHIWMDTGKDQDALPVFVASALWFTQNTNMPLFIDALSSAAEIFCRYHEWDAATAVLAVAQRGLKRMDHQPTLDRFASAVAKCEILGLPQQRSANPE